MAPQRPDELSGEESASRLVRESAREMIYNRALKGDRSFAAHAISLLYWKLDGDEDLSEGDSLFLRHVLYRISGSARCLDTISGSNRKGRASNGLKGMQVAIAVREELSSSEISVEEAWERVAEQQHLSPSMVKRHWMKWRRPYEEALAAARLKIQRQLNVDFPDGDGNG